MLFVSKITPIFALLTFKEKELAHQAYSSAPCQLGGLFLSHPARERELNLTLELSFQPSLLEYPRAGGEKGGETDEN